MFATEEMHRLWSLEAAEGSPSLDAQATLADFVTTPFIRHHLEGLGLCRQQPQGLPDPKADSPQVLAPDSETTSNGSLGLESL